MRIEGVTVKGFEIRDVPEAVTSGLAYYLDAGDAASYSGSGTAITNISGTAAGAAALINTPTFVSAGPSSYFTFNGTNQYVYTADLIGQSLTGSVTLECWVRTSSDNGVALTEQGSSSPNTFWYDTNIDIVAGNLKVAVWPHTLGGGVVVGAVTRNVWQQYTVTYSAGTCRGYINGGTTASLSVTRSFGASNLYYGIMLGTPTSLGDTSYLGGDWALFRAYDRALTAAEVLQNYQATSWRYA